MDIQTKVQDTLERPLYYSIRIACYQAPILGPRVVANVPLVKKKRSFDGDYHRQAVSVPG